MEKVTIKELKATDGRYLTQVADADDDRIFITAIKGVNINAADWREAAEEEKLAFEYAMAAKVVSENIE